MNLLQVFRGSVEGWLISLELAATPSLARLFPVLQSAAIRGDPAGHPPAGFLFRPYPGRLYGAINHVLAITSLGLGGQPDPHSALRHAARCAVQAQQSDHGPAEAITH
jgi:hypothetical protein